jgi:hypothetical protein
MTFLMTFKILTLSINNTQHNNIEHMVPICLVVFDVLSVAFWDTQSDFKLNADFLNVVTMNVVASLSTRF